MDDAGPAGDGRAHRVPASSPAAPRTRSTRSAAATCTARCASRRPPRPRPATTGILREWRIIEALDGTDVPHTAGHRRLRRPVGARPDLLPDGLRRRLVADGPARRAWPAPFDTDLEARQGLAYELVEGIALLVEGRLAGQGPRRTSAGPTASTSARSTAGPRSSSGSRAASSPASTRPRRGCAPTSRSTTSPGSCTATTSSPTSCTAHGAPARLAAIVDWEMGTVGDPKLDLGWVVQSWPEDTDAPEAAVGRLRRHDRHAVARRRSWPATPRCRAARSTTSTTTCVLAKWKLAIVLEQGFQRAGDDEKLQAFGPIVLELMAARRRAGRDHRLPGAMSDDAEAGRRSGAVPCSVLRLNRPEARNALTPSLIAASASGIVEAEADPDIRAVVLTGTGDRAFCAGMDLRAFAGGEADGAGDDADAIAGVQAAAWTARSPCRWSARPTAPRSPAASSCCSAATSSSPRPTRRVRAARGEARAVRRRAAARPSAPRIPLGVALEMPLTGDRIDAGAGLRARAGQPGRAARRRARHRRRARRAHRRQRPARASPRPRSWCASRPPTRPAPRATRPVAAGRLRQRGRPEGATAFVEKRAAGLAGALTLRGARAVCPELRPTRGRRARRGPPVPALGAGPGAGARSRRRP